MSQASNFASINRGSAELLVDLPAHNADIRQGSITPTTHLYRDLFKDIDDMRQESSGAIPGNMDDSIFYQDHYYHPTWKSEIVSFGINSHNAGIRPELARHNVLQALKIATLGAISNASNAVNYPQFMQQIDLTQYEQELMECAIRYLVDNKRKVVLVDTFPRALKPDIKKGLKLGDIEIPLPSESLPTHAVVLYQNVNGDILVIDPSNPKFSGHLQHTSKTIGCNLLISNDSSDKHKIYTPKGDTGRDPSHPYRDCVDISVKLAALLDIDQTNCLSVNEVMRSKAIFLVSNTTAITDIDIEKPLRIKQVSHLGKIEKINDALSAQNLSLKQKKQAAVTAFKQEQEVLNQKLKADHAQFESEYDQELSQLIGEGLRDADLGGYYDQ